MSFLVVSTVDAQTSDHEATGTACVIDSAAISRLKGSDVVTRRLGSDSVLTRAGRREWLGKLAPAIVGFGMDRRNLRADTTTMTGGERTEWTQILSQRYSPFGRARALPLERVTRIGEVQGASVFIERGLDLRSAPEIVYLLTSDCLFQPYVSPEGMR